MDKECAANICIRRMEPADLDQVAAIEADCFSEPWSVNGFKTSLQDSNTYFAAAVSAGEVIGYAGLIRSFEEADITNVAVREDCRGLGIGRKILVYMMEVGRKNGVERFTLEVRRSNAAAIHLYESLGFESVGFRKNFYRLPTEDANIMWTP